MSKKEEMIVLMAIGVCVLGGIVYCFTLDWKVSLIMFVLWWVSNIVNTRMEKVKKKYM